MNCIYMHSVKSEGFLLNYSASVEWPIDMCLMYLLSIETLLSLSYMVICTNVVSLCNMKNFLKCSWISYRIKKLAWRSFACDVRMMLWGILLIHVGAVASVCWFIRGNLCCLMLFVTFSSIDMEVCKLLLFWLHIFMFFILIVVLLHVVSGHHHLMN